jgi:hypothetical protein
MHDKYKKRFQAPKSPGRVRHQIAVEAARRLLAALGAGGDDDDPAGRLGGLSESELYTAKRKAAAVLGHTVRPGDLPSDSEVRAEAVTLARSKNAPSPSEEPEPPDHDAPQPAVASMADHLDRFAIYRMRLLPLEAVKQNAKYHPEGDALYHSLQVFDRAREARPYDEEFLLAALLHDVGKAIDATDHVGAALAALRGAVTDRTLWLIEHHMDLLPNRGPVGRERRSVESSEHFEDLKLLREVDDLGRVPGVPVGTVDEALAYLKGLEEESYLGSHGPS